MRVGQPFLQSSHPVRVIIEKTYTFTCAHKSDKHINQILTITALISSSILEAEVNHLLILAKCKLQTYIQPFSCSICDQNWNLKPTHTLLMLLQEDKEMNHLRKTKPQTELSLQLNRTHTVLLGLVWTVSYMTLYWKSNMLISKASLT